MTLFESGNIKQSFGGSMSARGTLDQKLQPGNNNNVAKIKICKNWNLVSLHFIWLRSLKICVFQAINGNSQKMILIASKRLSRLNLVSN